jgi:hypothetical protein
MQKEFAAFIGIDWADRKHDVCVCVPGSAKLERLVLEHRPAAIRAWAEKLRGRFGGAQIAVCLELSRGPIVSALLEHDFFVVFPVQPATLARYRSAFTTSRAKDDPTDTALALELLLRHPDKLTRLEPESVGMRSLRRLVEARRTLVEDRVRLTNRIISALKAYFPRCSTGFATKRLPFSPTSSSAGPRSSSPSVLAHRLLPTSSALTTSAPSPPSNTASTPSRASCRSRATQPSSRPCACSSKHSFRSSAPQGQP